jgi:DNA-nicking Smr family endonuclease
MVTIVTGKGSGVVREATLRWLETNSDVVADFFEVVDVSGSSGAYGVYLRL